MDSKDTKSSHLKATHHELGEPEHARRGEAIMKSDDPSTAALRAWAEDKQTQIPGSNGSFVTGQISMGTGAVSGGPMFLPRKEYNVEPPYHSVDHGPVDVVKHEEDGEGKKKRHSISNLFKRKGEGKSESETEVQERQGGKE
ncbi:MAG: hypothetical protein ALECFALPRED_000501 [Alectoria fallacina]|uniref:Uncharacterized protein n=1 Tax=Alectoria fallacina TaxID=1903189 RepID=A0A8H3F8M2_9LECA|nr:MAG: hypothetical protein ALECFALPRED_000501 [Alectoria fallacina]